MSITSDKNTQKCVYSSLEWQDKTINAPSYLKRIMSQLSDKVKGNRTVKLLKLTPVKSSCEFLHIFIS